MSNKNTTTYKPMGNPDHPSILNMANYSYKLYTLAIVFAVIVAVRILVLPVIFGEIGV